MTMKHHEQAAAPSVDPVQAAVANYPRADMLPPLTAASPDEVLAGYLHHRLQPTTRAQQQLADAFKQARLGRFMPIPVLDAKMAETEAALRTLHKQLELETPSQSPGSWRFSIAILRLSLEALASMVALVERWDRLTDPERQKEARQMNSALETKQFITASNAAAGASISLPNWRPFLDGLLAKGITVTATPAGDLAVSSAHLLSTTDRAHLAGNKAAIVASLGTVETF